MNVAVTMRFQRHPFIMIILCFAGFLTTSVCSYECLMCDNEAGSGECDAMKVTNKVTCTGDLCSVTSYVRNTATGCESSL